MFVFVLEIKKKRWNTSKNSIVRDFRIAWLFNATVAVWPFIGLFSASCFKDDVIYLCSERR